MKLPKYFFLHCLPGFFITQLLFFIPFPLKLKDLSFWQRTVVSPISNEAPLEEKTWFGSRSSRSWAKRKASFRLMYAIGMFLPPEDRIPAYRIRKKCDAIC